MKKGSGFVVQEVYVELRKYARDAYVAQLKQLGVKGKKLGDLEAGFMDGMTTIVFHLKAMGCIVTVDAADVATLADGRIAWTYKGKPQPILDKAQAEHCPMCYAKAIVKLGPDILKDQPDDTTHVCHALLGGCNHGFARDA